MSETIHHATINPDGNRRASPSKPGSKTPMIPVRIAPRRYSDDYYSRTKYQHEVSRMITNSHKIFYIPVFNNISLVAQSPMTRNHHGAAFLLMLRNHYVGKVVQVRRFTAHRSSTELAYVKPFKDPQRWPRSDRTAQATEMTTDLACRDWFLPHRHDRRATGSRQSAPTARRARLPSRRSPHPLMPRCTDQTATTGGM